MNVVLTGASGFIGKALLSHLSDGHSHQIRAVLRRQGVFLPAQVESVCVPNFSAETNWQSALADVGVVIHAAARAHVMNDSSADPLAEFRAVNVDSTLNLARQAAAAGVQRFLFISSIGVNGVVSHVPFTPDDVPAPVEPYAVSKLEAEQGLLAVAASTGLEVVIVRPPLVYGPDAPGNFGRLAHAVQRGVPLPLGAVHNQRSLVALDNLVDFLALCADRGRSPAAANQVFVICDGEDVSTTTLLRRVARAQGRSARLLPVPVSWMRFAARLLGKRAVADRLLGNLQVDASKARDVLGWRPVVSMEQQLGKMFSINGSA